MVWDFEMFCKNAFCNHFVNDMTECAEVSFEMLQSQIQLHLNERDKETVLD